jgi:hypothetical protein
LSGDSDLYGDLKMLGEHYRPNLGIFCSMQVANGDGIYVKAGLDKDKAALLVLIAALRDGRAELPPARRTRASAGGRRRRRVRRWRAREAGQREGRRLISFTHFLTRPRPTTAT